MPLPLRVLVPLLFGLGCVTTVSLLTLQHWRFAMREVEKTARLGAADDMSDLRGTVSYLLRQNNITGVQTVLMNQLSHRSLEYVMFVDEHDRVVASSRLALIKQPVAAAGPELAGALTGCKENRGTGKIDISLDGQNLFGCYPVILSAAANGAVTSPWGYLLTWYDLSRLKAEAWRHVVERAVYESLLLSAGFLSVLLVLRHGLARRRIAQVVNTTERLAAGELAFRVGMQGWDELATIGQAVDRMADQLQTTTVALQKAGDEMGQRVQRRTAELQQANETLREEIVIRKQIEEAIRRSESWLRSLIETTQDALISIDRQGRIAVFNPAAERVFGYTRAEIVGRSVNLLMPEPHASNHDEYIARYEKTGERRVIGRSRTLTAKRKSGELFPMEISVTEVVTDADLHYAGFIRDISEKVRLQQHAIENERLATIGAMAAKIGHELANPLNGMYLTIQLLEQRVAKRPTPVDSQITPSIKKIKDEIVRLNQLVQQFRTISRKETYEFRPTSLTELIEDVTGIERLVCTSLGIQIEHQMEPDLPALPLDSDKMKQALLNLYKNAVEAMPKGGKITVRASAFQDSVLLEISDTGVGIPPHIDVFEPFATTKKEGTGIGLVVVRQIVTAHGGRITYHSEQGKGTTFVLTLPRTPGTNG